ncbi:MAG: helix-turn-helix protein [Mucilaginibacter sp.]|nr:helix-turn-helix protein [Mucilaginibacter sp.]
MFGKKIRLCRIEKEYSQNYIAYCLNISQKAYSKIENNQTELTVRRLIEISKILELNWNMVPFC